MKSKKKERFLDRKLKLLKGGLFRPRNEKCELRYTPVTNGYEKNRENKWKNRTLLWPQNIIALEKKNERSFKDNLT